MLCRKSPSIVIPKQVNWHMIRISRAADDDKVRSVANNFPKNWKLRFTLKTSLTR